MVCQLCEYELVKNGILTDAEIVGEGYYHIVQGRNRDGELRQVCTRGPGKQYAATRIPILINPQKVSVFARLVDEQGNLPSTIFVTRNCISAADLSVLLVQMPREGNYVSGWEWNAPGGTGEPGENLKQVAQREFSEECALTVLAVENPFPDWLQFASGAYDEVQRVDFAIVVGEQKKLVEGGRRWIKVPMQKVIEWMKNQNQREDPSLWETEEFIPVDGKVYFAVLWMHSWLR